MLVQTFYLPEYQWSVKVYYAVDRYYTDDILQDLDNLNIDNYEYIKAKNNLQKAIKNTGFTYTNYRQKSSVIVIGLTTSSDEFQDTFDHEKGHLAIHIATYYHLDPYGEDIQYLRGDISKAMFPYAKIFLCDNCRKSFTI